MSLCFCSSSHFSSSTLHIFSVCCFVAIYHTHPHSAKITNAYACALACLRTLSAVWVFCLYRRLTNGDALSHTVQDDDLAAVPLATPAGELKFNSMRVTGRGKNTRLSSHSDRRPKAEVGSVLHFARARPGRSLVMCRLLCTCFPYSFSAHTCVSSLLPFCACCLPDKFFVLLKYPCACSTRHSHLSG